MPPRKKRCTGCRLALPCAEFYRDRRASDGRTARCKSCKRAESKARYAEDRERILSRQRGYDTRNRDAKLARDRRRYAEKREELLAEKRVYYIENRAQLRVKGQAHYARNAERLRAQARAYGRTERGAATRRASIGRYRARRREQDCGCVTSGAVAKIFALAESCCVYCGDLAEHLDHVVPLVEGGGHCVENLVPACARCNLKKNSRTVEVLAEELRLQGVDPAFDTTDMAIAALLTCPKEEVRNAA